VSAERHIEWTAPAPFWPFQSEPSDAAMRRGFRTPALLRFSSDEFTDQLLNLMNTEPGRLTEFTALPETWSQPNPDAVVSEPKTGVRLKLDRLRLGAVRRLEQRGRTTVRGHLPVAPAGRPLKLYQPSHGRHYMVCSCLVCRVPGLPDRVIETTAEEKVTFVVRRLLRGKDAAKLNPDPYQCDELAHVGDTWVRVSDAQSLVTGEEQFPLSPLTYPQENGHRRRMLAGVIPVGKREAYAHAKSPTAAAVTMDARQLRLKIDVLGPWATLEQTAAEAVKQAKPTKPTDTFSQSVVNLANDRIQAASWLILLDFAQWLDDNVNSLWLAIAAGSSVGLAGDKLNVYQQLDASLFGTLSVRAALTAIRIQKLKLESAKNTYTSAPPSPDWPNSPLFRFANAVATSATNLSPAFDRSLLETRLVGMLSPQTPPQRTPTITRAISNGREEMWFTIRCVLSRPQCGQLARPFLSEPSSSFEMAEYFDPDAPTRPIRIGLPVDTSPAGLRKFDKNTAFVMSDILCGQVNKAKSLGFVDLVRSVLPFPLNSDLSGEMPGPCGGGSPAGLVCSMSIPIITICALLILMIMVKLLDIIFYWLPFFQICLPLPNFNAKESS